MSSKVVDFPTQWRSGNEAIEPESFDHHCPQMGSGLNFYKHKCLSRINDPQQKRCTEGCGKQNFQQYVPYGKMDKQLEFDQILAELKATMTSDGKTDRQAIAKKTGVSLNRVSRVKSLAIKKGLL